MRTTREPRARPVEDAALTGRAARARLIDPLPVTERRRTLAGIPTVWLEGGEGPPLVLLHGPGESAVKWFGVIPELATTHRVIAPDLPGHGSSGGNGPHDSERIFQWLNELIERTCPDSPILVGQIVGGAIAARFAARNNERVERLVLVDALGLTPFQPAPEFWTALSEFLQRPTGDTYDRLWDRCAFDLDGLRERLGDRWHLMRAYNLDRAGAPEAQTALQSLMAEFGMPAIPRAELARITVPVTLIWGRHDLATPLSVAEEASVRYGWPLRVIEDARDDPAVEQPEAFVEALRVALGDR